MIVIGDTTYLIGPDEALDTLPAGASGHFIITWKGIQPVHCWLKDGSFHREDGPALIKNSYEAWYLLGELHRPNGLPAVTYFCSKRKEWWVSGRLERIFTHVP